MSRVPAKQAVGQGTVKVTVRVTMPDKSDAWSQQIVVFEDAPKAAARQAKSLVDAWVTQMTDVTDWDAILEGTL